jgi:hypothetical protein
MKNMILGVNELRLSMHTVAVFWGVKYGSHRQSNGHTNVFLQLFIH